MKQPRQIRGRIGIGRAKVTFARIGSYVGYINFMMLLLTFYSIKGYEYAPLWIYLIIALIGIITLGAIDYFVMLPCETAFGNEQWAKHQNPIYEEVKAISKEIKNIKEGKEFIELLEKRFYLPTKYISS